MRERDQKKLSNIVFFVILGLLAAGILTAVVFLIHIVSLVGNAASESTAPSSAMTADPSDPSVSAPSETEPVPSTAEPSGSEADTSEEPSETPDESSDPSMTDTETEEPTSEVPKETIPPATNPPVAPDPPFVMVETATHVWIGDSRMVYIERQPIIDREQDAFIAKGAMYFSWFKKTAVTRLKNYLDTGGHYHVIIQMGINDCANRSVGFRDYSVVDYINLINSLIEEYPNAVFWFISVAPDKGDFYGAYKRRISPDQIRPFIDEFNARMKAECHAIYLPIGEMIEEQDMPYADGVHFAGSTSQWIYRYVLDQIARYEGEEEESSSESDSTEDGSESSSGAEGSSEESTGSDPTETEPAETDESGEPSSAPASSTESGTEDQTVNPSESSSEPETDPASTEESSENPSSSESSAENSEEDPSTVSPSVPAPSSDEPSTEPPTVPASTEPPAETDPPAVTDPPVVTDPIVVTDPPAVPDPSEISGSAP